MDQHMTIWSERGPKCWAEGLPIGNGRLAAMVWGEGEDIISLNHEKLWRGVNVERDNEPVPHEVLGQIRDLIEKDKIFKATAASNVWFGGEGGGISRLKNRHDAYQPAGDLHFSLKEASSFGKRILDIKNAIVTVERITERGSKVVFTAYADVCDGLIVCRWESNEEFDGVFSYTRPEDNNAQEKCTYTDKNIFYECAFEGGSCFKTRVDFQTDGNVTAGKDGLCISEAKTITAYIDIRVFADGVAGDFPAKPQYDYSTMRQKHSETFAEKMDCFSLKLSGETKEMPTDERITLAKEGKTDDDLILLCFNYGRYLFLSANFLAELPANLQGKWNNKISPPWNSDYHFNINLQMNYWMAEPLGMGELSESLFTYLESFVPHAKKAAMDLYGCRGIWLPLASDNIGRSTPESFGYAVWIGAAAWMARHFWEHCIYSGDREFLQNRAYPFFKEVARFYEDYLVKDESGVYQIIPSQSPENAIDGVGAFPTSLGKSAAMDVQLAYDALGYAIKSAEILGIDEENVSLWKQIRDHLPPFKIGRDGRLLEWDKQWKEKEPGHRHLSHLYGLYPSDLFESTVRPEQYAAVKKSLDYRMVNGGGNLGWSSAWASCLYSRLGENKKAYSYITKVITQFSATGLWYAKQPDIFQIDANYGLVSAVTEMLAQHRGGKLYLLYALPESWQTGNVRGFKVPGGHTLDFSWKNGKTTSIRVKMGFSEKLVINIDGNDTVLEGKCGEVIFKEYLK